MKLNYCTNSALPEINGNFCRNCSEKKWNVFYYNGNNTIKVMIWHRQYLIQTLNISNREVGFEMHS